MRRTSSPFSASVRGERHGRDSFISDSDDDDSSRSLDADDSEALDRLIDKTKPQEQGEVGGATVYDDDGTVFACKETP